MDRLNVAVVGLGMGRYHIRQFQACPEASVIAVCDADPARLEATGSEFGIEKRFTDVEDLLALPDLHAVSIVLPNYLHAPVTLAAFKAGLHVMCEKPLAMNAAEAEAMIAAGKAAGRQLMVHFNTRFHDSSRFARQIIDEGLLGNIYFGRTGWHRNRGIPGSGWFTTRAQSGGGPLIDLGVHRLDLALWLMDYPEPIAVSGAAYCDLGKKLLARQGKAMDVEDLAAGFIRFANGASLVLEASWASNTGKREDGFTTLMGTRGGLLLDNVNETYEFQARAYQEIGGTLVEISPKGRVTPLTAQAAFVRAILEGQPVPAPGEQGLQVTRILDALYQSAETGAEVRL